jgi:hypothetical protein
LFHRQFARPRRGDEQIAVVDYFLIDAEAIHERQVLFQGGKSLIGVKGPPKITSGGEFAERLQDRRRQAMGMAIDQVHIPSGAAISPKPPMPSWSESSAADSGGSEPS